jgi:transposase
MTAEEQIAQLKAELAAQRAQNAMLQAELAAQREENRSLRAENTALREQMEQVVVRLAELEGRLAKDSHTSSKPPSSDGLGRKR